MQVRIEGIRETQGNFEGKPFHSVKFHISEPFFEDNAVGREVSVQSVKYERLPFVFNRPIELSEVMSLVGQTANFEYNKNKQLVRIKIDE